MNVQPPKSTDGLFFFVANAIAPEPKETPVPTPQSIPQPEPDSNEEFENLTFTAQQGPQVKSEEDDEWVDLGKKNPDTIFARILTIYNKK